MKLSTLLYAIAVVFIIFVGAYFIISPIALQTLEGPIEEATSTVPVSVSSTTQSSNNKPVVATTSTTTASIPPKPVPSKPVPTTPPPSTPTTPTQPTTPPQPTQVSAYTASEVAAHSSKSSCWSIINNEVYDLTSYISKHPGGSSKILKICGKDGSSLFEQQHGGESRPERTLTSYKIGSLK